MPEIVDLEVSRSNMLKKLKNKYITGFEIKRPNVLKNCKESDLNEEFVNKKLKNVDRKGKVLFFEIDDGKIVIHLMLTGDFVWKNEIDNEDSLVFQINFEKDIGVCIIDPKSWVNIEIEKGEIKSKLLQKDIGINPLSDDFTKFDLLELFQNKKRSAIKSFLLDQTQLSGIGNAYSDEILFDAGIHPNQKISKILEGNKVEQLYNSINKVIEESIETVEKLSSGTSISEQQRDFMKVYRKEGQNCPKCGGKIVKTKVSSRDTFFCPSCQKLDD